jgi:hypothetical protein
VIEVFACIFITSKFSIYFLYFLLTLKESNKEKAPEMTTEACLSARYTVPLPATKQATVRTISGLPSHISIVG